MAPRDDMDWICERFMQHLRKDFRGHKAEISPHVLMKVIKRFSVAYGMKDAVLLDAILRRNWIVPSAGNTYHIDYEAIRK